MDGSVSSNDWKDISDLKNLPFVLNPKKGYFVAANQRIVPGNDQIGSNVGSTARAIRIEELIL